MITNPQTLNVRIKHKYDTYANWLTSEIVLESGELAIAEIPSQQTFEEPDGSTVLTPPAIGIKVGNGSDVFKNLPWIQSTAGDVYAWAKEAEKPVYNAEEIEGLEGLSWGNDFLDKSWQIQTGREIPIMMLHFNDAGRLTVPNFDRYLKEIPDTVYHDEDSYTGNKNLLDILVTVTFNETDQYDNIEIEV